VIQDDLTDNAIGRRGLILGAGAAALAAGATLTEPAAAEPKIAPGAEVRTNAQAEGSPIATTIASAPVSGYIYRTVCMYDFEPFYPSSQRTWGGSGTYTAGTAGPLRATVEVPPGALVRDVEYYIFNNSGSSVSPDTYLYVAGTGQITSINAIVAVASGPSITATRVIIPATHCGPYPLGSRLLVGLATPTTGAVQINGARVGFTRGSGEIGLLDAPIRVYDSRDFTKLSAGATRTITLPSSIVAPGVNSVLINLIAINGEADGYLRVYSAAAGLPTSSSVNFPGTGKAVANWQIVGLSAARQIRVYASKTTDFVIDVTGTVS
jgi:hypothetical protein